MALVVRWTPAFAVGDNQRAGFGVSISSAHFSYWRAIFMSCRRRSLVRARSAISLSSRARRRY
jgi:hypothetical protein